MLIVGIAGGTGSGKTTVVKSVMAAFPDDEVVMIPQDSYYRDNSAIPLEERHKINFDHPDSIEFDLLTEHLKLLRKGKPIEMPLYSYLTCVRSGETKMLKPGKVVFLSFNNKGIVPRAPPEQMTPLASTDLIGANHDVDDL